MKYNAIISQNAIFSQVSAPCFCDAVHNFSGSLAVHGKNLKKKPLCLIYLAYFFKKSMTLPATFRQPEMKKPR